MTEADSANSTASILPENKRDGGKLKKNSEIFQTVLSSAVNEKVRIGFDSTTSLLSPVLLVRFFMRLWAVKLLYYETSSMLLKLSDILFKVFVFGRQIAIQFIIHED